MPDATLTKAIDDIMRDFVSPQGPGVAVLIGWGDRVLVRKAYGLADVEQKQSLVPENRFIIGSVTKQFVGMCVMMLKHGGLLDYDDPVSRFLPGFPEWSDRVTVRQLLQHTSGIPEYLTQEFWEEVNARDEDIDRGTLLNRMRSYEQLDFEPGSNWRYSNSNYILLDAIIEKASGRTFAQFVKEKVFQPLEMEDTFAGETRARPAGMAIGYEFNTKDKTFKEAPYNRAVVGWADGNIISTVDDMVKWVQAQSSDKLLPLAKLSQAFVPWNPVNPYVTRYGFGLIMGERRGIREIHHSGSTLGYNALLSRFPDEQLCVILLSNAAGIGLDRILGAIAGLMLGDKMQPLVPAVLPEEHYSEKLGRFRTQPWDRRLEIEVEWPQGNSPGLKAVMLANDQPLAEFDLLPLSRDLFLADRQTDSYVEFIRDYDGRVCGCLLKSVGRVSRLNKIALEKNR